MKNLDIPRKAGVFACVESGLVKINNSEVLPTRLENNHLPIATGVAFKVAAEMTFKGKDENFLSDIELGRLVSVEGFFGGASYTVDVDLNKLLNTE